MESGTQLMDEGQEVSNDASGKEDQVVASLVKEDNQILCPEPKENFAIANWIASAEADTDQIPSMQNEELPERNSPALIETNPASVKGEASQVQEDNQTLSSEPKDDNPVEFENASSTEAEQIPQENAELPQENGKASINGSKGVKSEVFGVASQILQDSLDLSFEPVEESLPGNGNTYAETHVEEKPTQNGQFLEKNGQAFEGVKAEVFEVDSQIHQDSLDLSLEPVEESLLGNGNASPEAHVEETPPTQNGQLLEQNGQALVYEGAAGVKPEAIGVSSETGLSIAEHGHDTYMHYVDSFEPLLDANTDPSKNSEIPTENAEKKPLLFESTTNDDPGNMQMILNGPAQIPESIEMLVSSSDVRAEKDDSGDGKTDFPTANINGTTSVHYSFNDVFDGNESGTEEEQGAFMKELESFFRDKGMEFKPPRFYRGELNCLKLWRSVIKLGGYDRVTSCKLWRQVGESFRPPKTCTTVSWTFRIFYEKALLEYERHKALSGELDIPVAAPSVPSVQAVTSRTKPMSVKNQIPGSGRARRDAAARAMQGWHSQRLLGNGEVSDPIIKDKNSMSQQKREKQQRTPGLLKRKKPEYSDYTGSAICAKATKSQLGIAIVDIGPPADWVKINVQKTKDCFEVYALVPGLLREEVCVQSDPAGRLVISGEPEHLDNPWGVTAFKKVVTLPGRIDPHQTSAVVTLHGQLFIRVPFAEPKTV